MGTVLALLALQTKVLELQAQVPEQFQHFRFCSGTFGPTNTRCWNSFDAIGEVLELFQHFWTCKQR
jgi:hypothetical protein